MCTVCSHIILVLSYALSCLWSPVQELDILQREMSAEAEDHDFQLTIMKQEGEQLGVENAAYVQG